MEDHRDTGGLSYFDEDNGNYEQKRAQNISKYKQSLMQEYEEEMRRKQQIQQFKAAKK